MNNIRIEIVAIGEDKIYSWERPAVRQFAEKCRNKGTGKREEVARNKESGLRVRR